jgi:molecular chaperone DnaJ
MADTRDLYQVLGVRRDASQQDIKKAFRRLARENHPDVNSDPEAERRFKEITLAYETLSDPAKRQRYDMFGGQGLSRDMFSFLGGMDEIFEAFFGTPFGRTRSRSPYATRIRRGSDLHVILDLAFEEAAFGARKNVEVERLTQCGRCGGNGAEPGTAPSRCRRCDGTGEISDLRRSVFGTMMIARPCNNCHGTGEVIASPCKECRGDGRVPTTQNVDVEVPAGVSDGMDLRIEAKGEEGPKGGGPGDLYMTLRVAPHPVFERRGSDLAAVLELPVTQALLGAEVEVSTLDGNETLRLPSGTRSGTVLRLPGQGVPHLGRRGRGDLYVEVDLVVPAGMSRKERALVEELADLRNERPDRKPAQGRLRPRA